MSPDRLLSNWRWALQIVGRRRAVLDVWPEARLDNYQLVADFADELLLVSDEFEDHVNPGEIYFRGREVIEHIRLIAALRHEISDAPHAGAVIQRRGDLVDSFQFIGSGISLPFPGSRAPIPHERRDLVPIERIAFELAESRPSLWGLLQHLCSPTWVGLYKAIEFIEDDLGGERALLAAGLIDSATIKQMKSTANAGAGDASRHLVGKFEVPNQVLTLDEASESLRALIYGWLRSVHANQT